MKKGYLSQYFKGVAIKHLSAVEADPNRSNQHEFNGVRDLCKILDEPTEDIRFDTKFLYLSDYDAEPIVEDGFMTWYDARRRAREERAVMRWEYRLYFPSTTVMQCASEGDLLVIARCNNDRLLAIVAESHSTIEKQLLWLFGFSDQTHPGFSVKSELETSQDRITFSASTILGLIGIQIEDEETSYLEQMLLKFNGTFPKTYDFSSYARSTIPNLSSLSEPDEALIAWMEREEILYRTLERHLLGENLSALTKNGVKDTESFIKLAQSTLQRRKSRAGSALENHLEYIFTEHKIRFTRGGTTENKHKPDFIFPGIEEYHSPSFPEQKLTMLASKSTCKDRWRQILNEANRVREKHLLTLEPSISTNQTNEMKSEKVQLVIPTLIQSTFSVSQRSDLMCLKDFIQMAKVKQIEDR